MKKYGVSLLFVSALLASCSNKNHFIGTYSFQLGREGETHAGASLTLTDEDYYTEVENKETHVKENKVVGKKYSAVLSVDMGVNTDVLNLIPSEEIDAETQEDKTEVSFIGYYNIHENKSKLNKSPQLLDLAIIFEKSQEPEVDPEQDPTGEENPGEGNEEETPTIDDIIDNEMVSKLIFSTITKNSVNMTIPVSIPDLALQLIWYGMDFDLYNLEPVSYARPDYCVPGSHPTREDIISINESKQLENSSLLALAGLDYFRDYNTVTINLTKNTK